MPHCYPKQKKKGTTTGLRKVQCAKCKLFSLACDQNQNSSRQKKSKDLFWGRLIDYYYRCSSTVTTATATILQPEFGAKIDIHTKTTSINQSINPSIHQSINPSIHPSINPSIHQSINPSIHQSCRAATSQRPTHKKSLCATRRQNEIYIKSVVDDS